MFGLLGSYKDSAQGSTYLFEMLSWKPILSQPYVGWIEMKTYSPTNFISPYDNIFLTVTEPNSLSEATVSPSQPAFACSHLAILTVE